MPDTDIRTQAFNRANRVMEMINEVEKDFTKSSRVFCFYIRLMKMAKQEESQLQRLYVIRDKAQHVIADEIGIGTQTIQRMVKVLVQCRILAVVKAEGQQVLENTPDIYVIQPLL